MGPTDHRALAARPLSVRRPSGWRGIAWWPYAVLRTTYCWVTLALLTLFTGIVYLPAAALGPNGWVTRQLERFWVWFILRGSNIAVRLHGAEQIVPGESYIVMANHRSMYDIPALHYLLGGDRDLRWIGKREVLRVPIFGWAYALSRHVAIDRQNRQQAIAALRSAASDTSEGVSFVIMPEGTRSLDRRLAPFKKGGFHLAIDTGLTILPVGITGTDKLMRKGEWWILPGSIDVRVGTPIDVGAYDKADLETLRDHVQHAVRALLPDLPDDEE